jgi:hypothetical protein
MSDYFAIQCRFDSASGSVVFLSVAATDANGQAHDVRPVTPALAELAERLVDETIVAETLVVASFRERWIEPDPRQ